MAKECSSTTCDKTSCEGCSHKEPKSLQEMCIRDRVTDYDKLTLDVYTNGTLDPDEAVSLAAKVLSEHLSLFIDLSENAKTAEVMIEKEDNEKEKVLEMSIDELEPVSYTHLAAGSIWQRAAVLAYLWHLTER